MANIIRITDEINNESSVIAASAKAVKTAYDKAVEAASGLPLGHFFTWPFSTPPDGSIIVNGSTYSRELYKDLWAYVSSNSDWVKTESEWQSVASANGGYCPYYSNGDGSTTFRTPKFAPYQQIALSSASAGTYHEAGLPNITGKTGSYLKAVNETTGTGCIKEYSGSPNVSTNSPVANSWADFEINASLSSDKYGKSDTVQPESTEWIVCVVAYGSATNVGNVDVANVIDAVNTVQSNLTNVVSSVDTVRSELNNYLPTAGGTLKGSLRFNVPGTEDRIGNIVALNDQNGKRIIIDTHEEGDCGAYISLRKGSDTINPGGFEIRVRNSDSSVVKAIEARTDGNLRWDGKQIVRSVNGATADAAGNVNVSVSNVSGNAATATKLKTARKITVQHYVSGNDKRFGMTPNYTGAGSASFDGSGNITIRIPSASYMTNCNCDNM